MNIVFQSIKKSEYDSIDHSYFEEKIANLMEILDIMEISYEFPNEETLRSNEIYIESILYIDEDQDIDEKLVMDIYKHL